MERSFLDCQKKRTPLRGFFVSEQGKCSRNFYFSFSCMRAAIASISGSPGRARATPPKTVAQDAAVCGAKTASEKLPQRVAMTCELTLSALLVVAPVLLDMCIGQALLQSDSWLGAGGLYSVCRHVRYAP